MPGSKRPPSKVLEQAQKLARAVKSAKGEIAPRPLVRTQKPRKKQGEATREKIVAALKKLHPMD